MDERRSTGLATASLVLGIISLVFSITALPLWILLFWISYVSLVISLIGLALSIWATILKQGGKAIAGLVCNIIALIFSGAVVFIIQFIFMAAAAA